MLDSIREFISAGGILVSGVICLVVAFAVVLLLRNPNGKWRWQRTDKPPRGSKDAERKRNRQKYQMSMTNEAESRRRYRRIVDIGDGRSNRSDDANETTTSKGASK